MILFVDIIAFMGLVVSVLLTIGFGGMIAAEWEYPWQGVIERIRFRAPARVSTSILLEVCEVCGIEYRPTTMQGWGYAHVYCPQHEQQAKAIPRWGDARLFWLFECHKCARIQPHGKCDTHDVDGLRHSKIRYYETDEDGWRRELLELPIGAKGDQKSDQPSRHWFQDARYGA